MQGLRRAPVDVTLVVRQNFTLFQPLVYQAATGALAPAEIATPSAHPAPAAQRPLGQAEVAGLELAHREVLLDHLPNGDSRTSLPYDTLIVAAGHVTHTSATTSGASTRPS